MAAPNKFVRASKFRHVFAASPKREHCWDGVKLTKSAWDSNFIAASSSHIAVAWQVGGGGAVGILDAKTPGKLATVPLFTGHKGAVLDLDFNPFHDRILATASEDCFSKIWKIGDTLHENMTDEAQILKGHQRKVGAIRFNPVAENIIATAAQDYELKIWDVSNGECKKTVKGHGGIIQSMEWNYNGAHLATYCKDHFLRVIDPRSEQIAGSVESFVGVKGARLCWLGKHEKILAVGFAKTAERQYAVYDVKKLDAPIVPFTTLDSSAGILMPFYDEDTDVLYLAGKGDGAIRYFEFVPEEEPSKMVFFLSQYSSNEPVAAACSIPKRGLDVNQNEVTRIYKVAGTQVQPLKFVVPRKSELFQGDLFPDCRSDEPALNAEAWIGGATATPKLISLAAGFVSKAKDVSFEKKAEATEPTLSEADLHKAKDELTKKVAYLEAELAKKEARIKELEDKLASHSSATTTTN